MEKLRQIKAVLIDCSGTLHIDNHALPNSVQALERLRNSQIKFILATNTTKESKESLLKKLNRMGFNVKPEELFTSLTAACSLVKKMNLHPHLVLEDDAKKDFQECDFDVNLELNQADSLVIGLANRRFDFKDMNRYFNFLHEGDKTFIGINKSRYFQTRHGLCLGPGPFIRCLEYASNKKAELVGKPNRELFRQAIDAIEPNLPFTCVAMIGDDLKDDIIGSQKLGMTGILVRTGKYTKEDENRHHHKPNFIFDSVVEAVDAIIENYVKE